MKILTLLVLLIHICPALWLFLNKQFFSFPINETLFKVCTAVRKCRSSQKNIWLSSQLPSRYL